MGGWRLYSRLRKDAEGRGENRSCGIRVEIVDMDGRTIDKVLATRRDPEAPEGTDEVVAP